MQAALAGTVVEAGNDFAVEQRVELDDGSQFGWHLAVTGGRVAIACGPADPGRPTVTFFSDAKTARQIAAGEASAQRLFLEARLRLSGDITVLLAERQTLELIGEALAEVSAGSSGLTAPA